MHDEIGLQFLHAFAEAATKRLGPEHAFTAACRAGDLTNVRRMLESLDREDADAMLAAAHKHLREDAASLLAAWRPGRPPAH